MGDLEGEEDKDDFQDDNTALKTRMLHMQMNIDPTRENAMADKYQQLRVVVYSVC